VFPVVIIIVIPIVIVSIFMTVGMQGLFNLLLKLEVVPGLILGVYPLRF
jgi:hypothetical protein